MQVGERLVSRLLGGRVRKEGRNGVCEKERSRRYKPKNNEKSKLTDQ